MAHEPHGPGKTAPKLKHDFSLFDPIRCSPTSNYLADFPPPVGEGPPLAPDIGSCRHEYTTKRPQSVLPPLDRRPDRGAGYRAAVVCKKCRIHAHVHVAFPAATDPCPNAASELHHFQRLAHEDHRGPDKISYSWLCSAPECRAKLRITYRLPRLETQHRDLLTDTERLRQRYEDLVKEDPHREGLKQASPVDALNRLRRYVKDSLVVDRPRRTFPATNKRFQEAFGLSGRDCHVLLDRLGFTYSEAQGDEPAQWSLPNPPEVENRLQADGDSHRELLEDVEAELLAWMCRLAAETPNVVNPAAAEGWPNADKDVDRVLAVHAYQPSLSLRRTQVSHEQLPLLSRISRCKSPAANVTRYFASLGALPDYPDRLVEFCFDRQCLCDPELRPYYFECLQVIAESRPNSESLQLKVATMSSQDLISRRDLRAAYRHLDIDPQADEERIANLFHSRQSDLGEQAQEDARQALYKIGVARGSQRLINASRQKLESYEDALAWIGYGVNESTSDEALLAAAASKNADNAENGVTTTKALSIIACVRKSHTLNHYALNPSGAGGTMSIEEALRLIGVEDKWESIDKDMLPMLFDGARVDRPGASTEKAIKTLEEAMAGNFPTSPHSPGTWPVGLTSHGNTCYLNSLLQYYFSIQPLREIVLDYDQYKLDTATQAQKGERVGQRLLSLAEISGGQKFAEDLKELFELMIKSSSAHVKPSEDLVCRTFLDIQEYKLLGAKDQAVVLETNGESAHAADDKSEGASKTDDDAEHGEKKTLRVVNGDQAGVSMTGSGAILTPPASPKAQPHHARPELPPRPASRPATRRFSTTREVALQLATEKAKAQQDVTEAHDLVMFRLRAGMTPKGRDETGEQIDDLANLFKITLTVTPVKDGVDLKAKPGFDSSITTLVPNETTDIYSLLDGVFDLQPSGTTGIEEYKTLTKIPPLFQINIPRINWDPVAGITSKSEACVKLLDELYLDRYCDSLNGRVLETRKTCWGWRKKLHALRKEHRALTETGMDLVGHDVVRQTSAYLSQVTDFSDVVAGHTNSTNTELRALGMDPITMDPELPRHLDADADQQQRDLSTLAARITALEGRLRGSFDDMKDIKYRLAAVFIHRGTTGHGHYWSYIRDFEKNMWRKYNDEQVEEFANVDEIYEAKEWNHGTPTYAVYVTDERKTEFISPICRRPEESARPDANAWRAGDAMQTVDESSAPERIHDGPNEPARVEVDPHVTTKESAAEWDQPRQVGAATW